ncbi:hypothetical protein K435DRAFT_806188 [Dendrothele bispora CBS 962.96]|uniref:Uncharacterized protein n=1 Tax=Dendrothele bispora (strain CBS 962.96) TaxID=1314807 RepID=A0A4S8L9Z5_DENBC|nr:hypothetical protein K435DRAFT_806188 [Dendrothele bispora CBS 962.96]
MDASWTHLGRTLDAPWTHLGRTLDAFDACVQMWMHLDAHVDAKIWGPVKRNKYDNDDSEKLTLGPKRERKRNYGMYIHLSVHISYKILSLFKAGCILLHMVQKKGSFSDEIGQESKSHWSEIEPSAVERQINTPFVDSGVESPALELESIGVEPDCRVEPVIESRLDS